MEQENHREIESQISVQSLYLKYTSSVISTQRYRTLQATKRLKVLLMTPYKLRVFLQISQSNLKLSRREEHKNLQLSQRKVTRLGNCRNRYRSKESMPHLMSTKSPKHLVGVAKQQSNLPLEMMGTNMRLKYLSKENCVKTLT